MRVTSPDQATSAIVIQGVGGGAAISSTYYVYLSEGDVEPGEAVFTATYCGGLNVSWERPKTLLIEYPSGCHIRRFTNMWWSKIAVSKSQGATAEIILVRKPEAIAPKP
jgi:hypothetical protein